MRKAEVDYRKFRLTNINSPEFSHLKLLFGWVGYFCFANLWKRFGKNKDSRGKNPLFVIAIGFWAGSGNWQGDVTRVACSQFAEFFSASQMVNAFFLREKN